MFEAFVAIGVVFFIFGVLPFLVAMSPGDD